MRPPEPPATERDFDKFCFGISSSGISSSPYLENYRETGEIQESGGGEDEQVIFIQTRKVGYLIGHHGRTISGFESTTGAKIDILKPNSQDCETPVKITGSSEKVRHAIRLIMDLYALNNFSSQIWQNPSAASGFTTTTTSPSKSKIVANEEILLDPSFASFLVYNEYICYMEAQSGAKILICREQESNPGRVPLNIVGSCEAITTAIRLIDEQHQSFASNPSLANLYHNMQMTIQPDNPYKKFGKCKEVFFRRNSLQEKSGSFFDGHSSSMCTEQVSDSMLQDYDSFDDFQLERDFSLDFFILKSQLDRISLHPICKANNVTMETFINDGVIDKYGSRQPLPRRKIVIRGLEPNVRNAKLDLIKEVAQV